jgi:hypothetical protein
MKMDKRDPMLEKWNYLVESGKINDEARPNLFISETTRHYSNTLGAPIIENWIYKNVVLYGFTKSTSTTEISQEIKGFATHKELGPVDTSFINLTWLPQLGYQEVVVNEAKNNTIGNILSNVMNFISS